MKVNKTEFNVACIFEFAFFILIGVTALENTDKDKVQLHSCKCWLIFVATSMLVTMLIDLSVLSPI